VAELDDDVEVEITEEDLRVDTYRSGGAGGQHVNTTDSAIRLTHLGDGDRCILPVGAFATCQPAESHEAPARGQFDLMLLKHYLRRNIYEDQL